jgi:hypothetical protein
MNHSFLRWFYHTARRPPPPSSLPHMPHRPFKRAHTPLHLSLSLHALLTTPQQPFCPPNKPKACPIIVEHRSQHHPSGINLSTTHLPSLKFLASHPSPLSLSDPQGHPEGTAIHRGSIAAVEHPHTKSSPRPRRCHLASVSPHRHFIAW